MVARVQLPAAAKQGEVIEVRISIQHPMETGFRFDAGGSAVPRNVINQLVCRYNGAEVFRAEMGSGMAANPYVHFTVVARASGKFDFEWIDDAGVRDTHQATLSVT